MAANVSASIAFRSALAAFLAAVGSRPSVTSCRASAAALRAADSGMFPRLNLRVLPSNLKLTAWDSREEIPVLDGHTVTRISASFDGAKLGSAVRLVNHDMRRFWKIGPASNVFPLSPWPSTRPLRVGWGVLLALLLVSQVLPAFVNSPIRSDLRTVLSAVWSLLVVVKVVRDLMVRRDRKAAAEFFRRKELDLERFDAECDQLARSLLAQ